MNGSKDHLVPHLAVENEMVGIKLDALARGQLIDAPTAFEIADELNTLGARLNITLQGVKVDAARMEFDDADDEKSFVYQALTERLGLNSDL